MADTMYEKLIRAAADLLVQIDNADRTAQLGTDEIESALRECQTQRILGKRDIWLMQQAWNMARQDAEVKYYGWQSMEQWLSSTISVSGATARDGLALNAPHP